MRVLQIGSDRSKRGLLFQDSPTAARQRAYAAHFDQLDIIGFSLRADSIHGFSEPHLSVYPTNSISRLFYGLDALRVARSIPNPDIVSAQDPFEAGLVAWFIARRTKAALHVQVHTDFLSSEYARHSLLNRIRVRLAMFVLRRASRVRVVSTSVKAKISRVPLDVPITVLPIFVDVEKFKHAQASPEIAAKFEKFSTKLLVVARLEPEKNVELAIRAFAEAAPNDACLIVLGEGSERKRLEEYARALSVHGRVLFEGAQPSAPYYQLADLVIVPSKYEGYGLVIIEALAAGKPVLSTDVGIAREAGAIVTSEQEFAGGLRKWFEDGPREGRLNSYPYENFDDYVRAYCGDIAACVDTQKRQ